MISKIILICDKNIDVLQIEKENSDDKFTIKGHKTNKVWKFTFYIDINYYFPTNIKLKFSHCDDMYGYIDYNICIDIGKEIYKHKFIYKLNYYKERHYYCGETYIDFYVNECNEIDIDNLN